MRDSEFLLLSLCVCVCVQLSLLDCACMHGVSMTSKSWPAHAASCCRRVHSNYFLHLCTCALLLQPRLFFTDWSDMPLEERMSKWDRCFKLLCSYPQVGLAGLVVWGGLFRCGLILSTHGPQPG